MASINQPSFKDGDDYDGESQASFTGISSLKTDSFNGGGPISDGDGTERQIYVIPSGASNPAGADPEDIIFEEV